MKKIAILSFLIFSHPLFAMEKIGYPIGTISCIDHVSLYEKIANGIKTYSCKDVYGFDLNQDPTETLIFVYEKKINKKEWGRVHTINGQERWVPIGDQSNDDAPLDDLNDSIKAGLFDFNSKWDQKIYEDPEKGRVSKVKEMPYEVEITKSEFFDGKLWVKINIYDGSKCINEDEKPPKLIHSGWVPFMRTNTESNFEKPFECG